MDMQFTANNLPSRIHTQTGGFTLIEVMVALAIVAVSLAVFIGILGDSLRIRGKLDDHARLINTARVKAEELELGLIQGAAEGKTEDGIQWETSPVEVALRQKAGDEGEAREDIGSERHSLEEYGPSMNIGFYKVVVGGVEIISSTKRIGE